MMLPVGGQLEVTGLLCAMNGFMSSASDIPESLSLWWYGVTRRFKVGEG